MVLPSRPDVELLELLVELLRLLDVDVTAEVRLALALPPDVELLELLLVELLRLLHVDVTTEVKLALFLSPSSPL